MKFFKKHCYTLLILFFTITTIVTILLIISDNKKATSSLLSPDESYADSSEVPSVSPAPSESESTTVPEETTTVSETVPEDFADPLTQDIPDDLLQQLNPDLTFTNISHHITVPYIYQLDEYPTGCEIVSATMLLQYWNYDYSVQNMIDNYLPMSDLDYNDQNDELSGESPYTSFIGTPYQENSYGCYLPVIQSVLNNVTNPEEHAVYSTYGMSLEELCAYFIQNDIPVLIWETINMRPSFPSSTWNIIGTEDTFTWLANEHCMVLVGYDENYYYFNDPYNEVGIVSYEKALCQERYEELGTQSLVLVPIV